MSGRSGGAGTPGRILVVDDDEDIRDLLALTLRHEGWEIAPCGTGAAALAAVAAAEPAALLVDYELPDMTGAEVIRRAHALAPALPCIVVTGQGSERVAVEVMKGGATDYLVKPFEPQEVVAAIERAVEERRFRKSRLYRDLTEDLAAKNALLEHRMQQLSRLMSETSTLYEAARILTSQLSLSEVLATVLRFAGELFQCAASSVRLLDASGERLELAAHAGLGEQYRRRGPLLLGNSAAGRAAATGEPVHVLDASCDEVYQKGEDLLRENLRSLLCLPLLVRGRCVGVMTLYHRRPRRYEPEELRFLTTFASTVSIAVDNARLYGEQARLAVTDGLTGLFNHKHFQESLAAEVVRARRYSQPLALLLADIDHFKRYNDSWGHQAGDAVLRQLGALFRAAARQNDLVARYGGEEFAFILPQTDKRQATALAKRLCRSVGKWRFEGDQVFAGGHLTISVGVASLPEDVAHAAELIRHADRALYRAKNLGRNQVQAWRPPH